MAGGGGTNNQWACKRATGFNGVRSIWGGRLADSATSQSSLLAAAALTEQGAWARGRTCRGRPRRRQNTQAPPSLGTHTLYLCTLTLHLPRLDPLTLHLPRPDPHAAAPLAPSLPPAPPVREGPPRAVAVHGCHRHGGAGAGGGHHAGVAVRVAGAGHHHHVVPGGQAGHRDTAPQGGLGRGRRLVDPTVGREGATRCYGHLATPSRMLADSSCCGGMAPGMASARPPLWPRPGRCTFSPPAW